MIEIKPEHKQKPIRSYVVRAGRMTDAQRKAFDRHWPSYGLKLVDGLVDWKREFQREAPVVLEVGFGMGDSLLEMAIREPEKDFVGIEVHPPGVGRLINRAAEMGVNNLRVYLADALDVLEDCIPDGSLDRVQLYFPDPWHKKKHHKRRILQPEFVQLVRQKLCPGGLFHLATDWENYAEQMLEILSASDGFENTSPEGGCVPRPPFRPVTKFEKRGEHLGHGIRDILFRKLPAERDLQR